MRIIADTYGARVSMTYGKENYKFPTDMRFEEEGDQSIEQDSIDILKPMFKNLI